MIKNIFLALTGAICLFTHLAFAQSNKKQVLARSKNCDCPAILNETTDKVSRIYAGFEDKVNKGTRANYEQLLTKVRQRAQQVKTPAACLEVLRSYTAFFKDKHVFIIYQGENKKPVLQSDINTGRQDLVAYKQLNKDYVYLKLAVFDQREVDQLDSLLRVNATSIAKTPNLIFDLRGNRGGNASTSEEMIKLIYTNPIIYPAWDYRSSAERIKASIKEVASYKDTVADAFFYNRAKQLLQGLKSNPGALVKDTELKREIAMDTAANPQRVAFLIDQDCASSTEFFVYEGKQSKKVTTFGTNTHGVMDYGSVQNFNLGDGTFNLAVPWGRNGWVKEFRIDNVGFTPDVQIPAAEKDWVEYVQEYYINYKKLR